MALQSQVGEVTTSQIKLPENKPSEKKAAERSGTSKKKSASISKTPSKDVSAPTPAPVPVPIPVPIPVPTVGKAPKKSVSSPSRTLTDPTTSMEFVYVKGGCFQMGDTFETGGWDEKPVHDVCLDDFYLGKYEVTQKQWETIMKSNPSGFKKLPERDAILSVCFFETCKGISALTLKLASCSATYFTFFYVVTNISFTTIGMLRNIRSM